MTSVPLTADHMSEFTEPRANPNAQFLAGDVPHHAQDNARLGGGMAVSLGSHIAGVLLFLFVIANMPDPAPSVAPREVMPTDRCVVAYNCPTCAGTLRPKTGDCCVFCSYADRPCPPIQDAGSREGRTIGETH